MKPNGFSRFSIKPSGFFGQLLSHPKITDTIKTMLGTGLGTQLGTELGTGLGTSLKYTFRLDLYFQNTFAYKSILADTKEYQAIPTDTDVYAAALLYQKIKKAQFPTLSHTADSLSTS